MSPLEKRTHLENVNGFLTWRQDIGEALHKLILEGISYRTAIKSINRDFNVNITRNAAIGYITRNYSDLTARTPSTPRVRVAREKTKKPLQSKFKSIEPIIKPIEYVGILQCGSNTRKIAKNNHAIARLEDLEPNGCKFIDDNDNWCNCQRFVFNGKKQQYCEEHFLRCYRVAA